MSEIPLIVVLSKRVRELQYENLELRMQVMKMQGILEANNKEAEKQREIESLKRSWNESKD